MVLCLVLLAATSFAVADSPAESITGEPNSAGVIAEDPAPLRPQGRFDSTETALILKHAHRADAVYPQVGGIIRHNAVGNSFIFEPFAPLILTPLGSCSSDSECAADTDEMCEDAGHVGSDAETAEVSTNANGDQTCSADCSDGSGAVAIIICRSTTIIDDPDPIGIGGGHQDVSDDH